MEYKYEQIFGDQSLFDGAPEDAEYAGWFCQETRWYMILNGKILFSDGGTWCTSDNPYLSADIAAMRRIIKTPVWTVADREAGRLPEVGAKFFEAGYGDDEVIKIIDSAVVALRPGNHGAVSISKPLFFKHGSIKPIETLDEKAQRLRDEWIDNACSFICFYDIGRVDAIKSLEITYDKLKSGELSMPGKE